MRVAYAEHHLCPTQLGQFAPLTVVKRFGEFLQRHDEDER
jgi:hypothetical protein